MSSHLVAHALCPISRPNPPYLRATYASFLSFLSQTQPTLSQRKICLLFVFSFLAHPSIQRNPRIIRLSVRACVRLFYSVLPVLWYYPCVVLCFSVSQKLENGAQQATRLLVITFVPLFVLPPTLPFLRRIYIPPFPPLPCVVCKDTFLVLMPQFFSVIICCLWMCAVLCLSVTRP